MAPRVEAMAKTHIVYKFLMESKDEPTKAFIKALQVQGVPVIRVFKNGTPIERRFPGIQEIKVVLKGVKTRKSQENSDGWNWPDWLKLW